MKRILSMFIIAFSVLSIAGCGGQSRGSDKSGNSIIDEKGIALIQMHNNGMQYKDVKKNSDKSKILKLVNSLNLGKSYKELRDGIGYGFKITYNDGREEYYDFGSSIMRHNDTYYEIDKNIYYDLINIYDILK